MTTNAYHQLTQFLDKLGLPYETHQQQQIVDIFTVGQVTAYHLIAHVPEDHLLVVTAIPTIRIPAGARPNVAQALSYVNDDLAVGYLNLSWEKGWLFYRASTLLQNGELTEQMVGHFLLSSAKILEKYLPAVLSIIYANDDPADAIRLAREAG